MSSKLWINTSTNMANNQSSSERFVLEGWPLIEEWMTKLDERMVRDFHEDINTLLTFVRLRNPFVYSADTERISRRVYFRRS